MAPKSLHHMKKLEVVIEGEHLSFLQGLLKQAGITGYTMIRDVAGMGHSGPHAGRLTYNDLGSYVMVVTVGPDSQISAIVEGMSTYFEEHSGVMFVSDTAVLRADYFAPQ